MTNEERVEKLAEWLSDRDHAIELNVNRLIYNPTGRRLEKVPDATSLLAFLSTLGCVWLAEDQNPPEIKRRMALTTQRMIARYYREAGFRRIEEEK